MESLTRTTRDWLSLKVLMPFSHLQQMARPSLRPFRVAFYEGLRFRREAGAWGLDQKREWMLRRLRVVVRKAYHETDYYRAVFDRIGFDPQADFSFEDFSRLPALDREDVHRAGKRMVSEAVPKDQLRKDATGGSTGVPTTIWLGPEEWGWRESATEHFMQRLGLPSGSRTGLFWGHHLDPASSNSLRDRIHSLTYNTRWFDCFRLSPQVFENYHQELEQWRPACVIAYASALGAFAEYLLESGQRPSYPTGRLVTGAEKLMPHHRQAIEAVFKAPAHERYGGRDAGCIGYQMNSPGFGPDFEPGFEVDWANVLVEPESGEMESPILVTKLHADAMPMLRYRVGDLGRFPAGSGPGRPTFALREVVGRVTDKLYLPDGRWIHGNQLPHLMKDYPVREFMLVQRPNYSVELMIVPRNGFNSDSRRKIEETINLNLPGLDVQIEMVERVPRTKANKWRVVVSEVKSGREVTA